MGGFQASEPVSDQTACGGDVQLLVPARIFFKICQGELEQRGSGTRMIFLQMDKCPGELDQTLVKHAIGSVFVLEPQIFQHLMRLVKKLPVEAIEKAGVMRVESLSVEGLNPGGDAGALVTHRCRIKAGWRVTSDK